MTCAIRALLNDLPHCWPHGILEQQATATTGVLYRLSNQLLSDLMDKIPGTTRKMGGDPERNQKEVIFTVNL